MYFRKVKIFYRRIRIKCFPIFIWLITLQMIHIYIQICPVRNTKNFPATVLLQSSLDLKVVLFYSSFPLLHSQQWCRFFFTQTLFFISVFLNSTWYFIFPKDNPAMQHNGANLTFSVCQRWNLLEQTQPSSVPSLVDFCLLLCPYSFTAYHVRTRYQIKVQRQMRKTRPYSQQIPATSSLTIET